MAKPDRRLAPIVSLDVVGYTRMVGHSESQTLRLVRRVYDVLVARTVEAAGGKVFKTMGDGALIEFNSVVAAVEWVATQQRVLNERQIRAPGGVLFGNHSSVSVGGLLVTSAKLDKSNDATFLDTTKTGLNFSFTGADAASTHGSFFGPNSCTMKRPSAVLDAPIFARTANVSSASTSTCPDWKRAFGSDAIAVSTMASSSRG